MSCPQTPAAGSCRRQRARRCFGDRPFWLRVRPRERVVHDSLAANMLFRFKLLTIRQPHAVTVASQVLAARWTVERSAARRQVQSMPGVAMPQLHPTRGCTRFSAHFHAQLKRSRAEPGGAFQRACRWATAGDGVAGRPLWGCCAFNSANGAPSATLTCPRSRFLRDSVAHR